ncbi:MAG: OB-fold domain-containing protein, partial [Thermodesulfobacteriota bacterium]|nr:OB-fold domain-containing protein [Thermodesulfobacteriota bacterium]
LIGKDDVIADLKGSYSVCQEIMDVWRIEGSRFVRSWEDRFIGVEGYQKVMKDAVSGVLKETGLKPADFAKVVFYSPDQKSSMQLSGKLGFDPKTQLQDNLFGSMGNTGTPYTLMMLVAALEDSNPGDKILLVNYGNGADAFVFEVTDRIKDRSSARGLKDFIDSKQVIDEYQKYIYSKALIQGIGPVYPVPFGSTSAPAVLREVDKNLRFHGVKCEKCGTVQYPPQRTCVKCHTKDQFQAIRLSDKKGKIFTFSMDSVSSMINSPAVISVVDFEGGGRTECFLTDALIQDVKVGMDVEMTFRKLAEREDIINYAWKAMPVRF